MCWSCDMDKSSLVGSANFGAFGAARSAPVFTHFQKATDARYYFAPDAFPADGVGDFKGETFAPTTEELALTEAVFDGVPNDTSSTQVLEIGGSSALSTINTPGDDDFYKVTLKAGETYEFGMYQTTSGPSGVPLFDPYVEIYDAQGNLLTSGDGGATTQRNTFNEGFDVLLAFTAPKDGTYYINATSFDQAPQDPLGGESVGDYELFGRLSSYKPYYDLNSPLHSIDWGTQFDGTSRNPDGAEGPRPTGNEVESKIGGKNVIYVYFARQGEVFVDNSANPLNLTTTMVAKGLQPWEQEAFQNVFAEYEKVADLDYVLTDDRWAADIVIVTYDGTPGPGLSLLGRMSPPDTPSEGQTEYNAGDERWTQQDLAPGGFYFSTLIHEFGHGHGMAHPHDDGGHSSEMRGVESAGIDTPGGTIPDPVEVWPNYTLGDFKLNQGIYTMMSYQDGWQEVPWGQQTNELGRAETKSGYGWIGSLMAFDIAVIQDKYGVNEEWAKGNDTYRITDENVAAEFDSNGKVTREATSWKSIWDAGGTDQIVYSGSRDANIDLRPATLKYEEGGGGFISYAWGIYGGFTVANAVTIENASSGSGDDKLIGNNAANVLSAGGGADRLHGVAGNDTLNGGTGGDRMWGGIGNDLYYVDSRSDEVIEKANQGTDTVRSAIDFELGTHVENLVLTGDGGTDGRGNSGDNRLTGNGGANLLAGGGGDDRIDGGAGNDRIYGGGGRDTLEGGSGRDGFYFTERGSANADRILDFAAADDTIFLSRSEFSKLAAGALSASAFRQGSAAADASDRIIYDKASGRIFYDPDGNGSAAATLFATVDAGTSLTSADFVVYG